MYTVSIEEHVKIFKATSNGFHYDTKEEAAYKLLQELSSQWYSIQKIQEQKQWHKGEPKECFACLIAAKDIHTWNSSNMK